MKIYRAGPQLVFTFDNRFSSTGWAVPQSVRYIFFRLQPSYLSVTSHTGRKSCRVKSLYMKRFCSYPIEVSHLSSVSSFSVCCCSRCVSLWSLYSQWASLFTRVHSAPCLVNHRIREFLEFKLAVFLFIRRNKEKITHSDLRNDIQYLCKNAIQLKPVHVCNLHVQGAAWLSM